MGVSRSVRWNLILRLDSSYLVQGPRSTQGVGATAAVMAMAWQVAK